MLRSPEEEVPRLDCHCEYEIAAKMRNIAKKDVSFEYIFTPGNVRYNNNKIRTAKVLVVVNKVSYILE